VAPPAAGGAEGGWRGAGGGAADGSPLRRSALRHRAIPALASALGMDPVPALARTAVLCAHDDDALAQWARELTGAARVADAQDLGEGVASVALAVSLMRGAPRAVRTRTLREAARAAGLRALSSGHIDELDDLVVAWRGQGPIHLPGGLASRVGRGERAQIILRAHPAGEDGHQS